MSDEPKSGARPQSPKASGPAGVNEGFVREIMADVERLVARHHWEGTARNRMAFLLRETIELAEEVLQLPDAEPYDAACQQRVGREIYDVMWNICDLARLTGVDLVAAAVDKRQINERRTWPTVEER